ncbi:hypothetical protein NQ038_05875 [Brevibacterium sp. 50QC2O2]|uniref:hypothetical protein n=1 Tax=Brevibacterium sp. 50QC2O2 TaxID=2968459 RepID=UPI00211C491F|nr:hypothetical protein [Brevibacterium sp. 50QC2O2]MCQ9388173.1 hypothetical protein [Brevibacterium sp. 50QC2O2]
MYLQIHEPVITSLRPSERDYLRAMGQDDAGSRTSDIAERLGISAQNAGGIRERLISQGIIESTGWGTVAFTIPYTADYFTQPPARP